VVQPVIQALYSWKAMMAKALRAMAAPERVALPDEALGTVDVVGWGALLLEADLLGVAVLTAALVELGVVTGVELGVGVTEWELGVEEEDAVAEVLVEVAEVEVVVAAL